MDKPPILIATAHRHYTLKVACLMVCYTIILCISLKLIPTTSNHLLKTLLALLPVIPIALILAAVIQIFSRVDEMCRRIHLEAAALTAGITALLAITSGFLQNVGMPLLSGFWTFAVINLLYATFVLILNYRYR